RTAWRGHSLPVGQNPLESKARIAVIDTVSFALGHKRTFRIAIAVSALPPKADIPRNDCFVRFGPKADSSAIDGIPNCACHWVSTTGFNAACLGAYDAATLWQPQIASDAVPLDARGDGSAISANREEYSSRRSPERRISTTESQRSNSNPRGW